MVSAGTDAKSKIKGVLKRRRRGKGKWSLITKKDSRSANQAKVQ
jgi:hypothetical protein